MKWGIMKLSNQVNLPTSKQKYLRLEKVLRALQFSASSPMFSKRSPSFLINLKAGGTVLTLHRADTVFHLDPWWNPASEHQTTDHVHRIGQKRNVFVYKLIAKDTIEEKVIYLQKKKQEFFDSLFDKQKKTNQAIAKDELMSLLDAC